MLPPGAYKWQARTLWSGLNLSSDWVQAPRDDQGNCFVIGDVAADPVPKPPVNPFDLIVDEFFDRPGIPQGLRASSWHPNGDQIRFEFEVKAYDEAWNGQIYDQTDYI
jgi:hypothetical protein